MATTKNKILAYVLSFIMAFTVFGVLSISNAYADGENPADGLKVTVSYAPKSTLNDNNQFVFGENNTNLDKLQGTHDVTAEVKLSTLVKDLTTDNMYTWYNTQKGGQKLTIDKVSKGIYLKDVVAAAAGTQSAVGLLAYEIPKGSTTEARYQKCELLSRIDPKGHNYPDAKVKKSLDTSGKASFSLETKADIQLDGILALEYSQAELDGSTITEETGTVGPIDDSTTWINQKGNRVFVGMTSVEDFGGYHSPSGITGLDVILPTTDIGGAEVTLGDYAKAYDGTAKTPAVAVKLGDEVLVENTDYSVEYKDNTNVGTATVTITGINAFEGTIEKTFVIEAASIAGAKVEAANQTYNGNAQTPAPTVTLNGKTLKAGTDYSAAYTNNTKAGKATVTVTGKGDYVGTAKGTFTINKAANTFKANAKKATVKFKTVKKKKVTVAAKKVVAVSKAQGKVTYKKVSGNKKITVAKSGKVTVKKKTKKGTYKIKVKVTAAGNANYKAGSKNVTFKIVVK